MRSYSAILLCLILFGAQIGFSQQSLPKWELGLSGPRIDINGIGSLASTPDLKIGVGLYVMRELGRNGVFLVGKIDYGQGPAREVAGPQVTESWRGTKGGVGVRTDFLLARTYRIYPILESYAILAYQELRRVDTRNGRELDYISLSTSTWGAEGYLGVGLNLHPRLTISMLSGARFGLGSRTDLGGSDPGGAASITLVEVRMGLRF